MLLCVVGIAVDVGCTHAWVFFAKKPKENGLNEKNNSITFLRNPFSKKVYRRMSAIHMDVYAVLQCVEMC